MLSTLVSVRSISIFQYYPQLCQFYLIAISCDILSSDLSYVCTGQDAMNCSCWMKQMILYCRSSLTVTKIPYGFLTQMLYVFHFFCYSLHVRIHFAYRCKKGM